MSEEITALVAQEHLAVAQEIEQKCVELRNTIITPIANEQQYEVSGTRYRELKTFAKRLEDARTSAKAPLLEKGRLIDRYFNGLKSDVTGVSSQYNVQMDKWERAQAEIARKEQARLDKEAEEKRRRAEEAARKEREKAEALREAGRADLAANAEARADQKEQKAETIVAPIVQPATPKLDGVSTRQVFKVQITDPVAFVRYAIKNDMYSWLLPNEKAFLAYSKSINKELQVDGGRTFWETTRVGRSL